MTTPKLSVRVESLGMDGGSGWELVPEVSFLWLIGRLHAHLRVVVTVDRGECVCRTSLADSGCACNGTGRLTEPHTLTLREARAMQDGAFRRLIEAYDHPGHVSVQEAKTAAERYQIASLAIDTLTGLES